MEAGKRGNDRLAGGDRLALLGGSLAVVLDARDLTQENRGDLVELAHIAGDESKRPYKVQRCRGSHEGVGAGEGHARHRASIHAEDQ